MAVIPKLESDQSVLNYHLKHCKFEKEGECPFYKRALEVSQIFDEVLNKTSLQKELERQGFVVSGKALQLHGPLSKRKLETKEGSCKITDGDNHATIFDEDFSGRYEVTLSTKLRLGPFARAGEREQIIKEIAIENLTTNPLTILILEMHVKNWRLLPAACFEKITLAPNTTHKISEVSGMIYSFMIFPPLQKASEEKKE